MKGILLTLIAVILGYIIGPIGMITAIIIYIPTGRFKDYTMDIAIALDAFLNVVCAPILNLTLVKGDYYPYGNRKETVSSSCGKNKLKGTLTMLGRFICWALDGMEKLHVEKAIDNNV